MKGLIWRELFRLVVFKGVYFYQGPAHKRAMAFEISEEENWIYYQTLKTLILFLLRRFFCGKATNEPEIVFSSIFLPRAIKLFEVIFKVFIHRHFKGRQREKTSIVPGTKTTCTL